MPIITKDQAQIEVVAATDTPCGPSRMIRYSDTGGLTQFGAFVEILPPGSRSSLCHWHQNEDEFIYMLTGQVTVYEGGIATLFNPGDSACFKAGVPNGHYIKNEGIADATYLVVGTRASSDKVTYPDHDRIFYHEDDQPPRFTTIDGTPAGSAYRLPGA